jgi:NAD(P)H-hydrate epimerase
MEHAARGLAALAAELAPAAPSRPVAVVCGPGQNGGDGLGAARFLRSFGFGVDVVRLGDRPYRGDAAVEFAALSREIDVPALVSMPDVVGWARNRLPRAGIVIDALFGTGLDRDLDALAGAVVLAINACAAPTIAVDLPSGLDGDTGEPKPFAVEADVTAAMGFVKRGCAAPRGSPFCGRLIEIDIGLPLAIHGPYRV